MRMTEMPPEAADVIAKAMRAISKIRVAMLAVMVVVCVSATVTGVRGLATVIWRPEKAADATLVEYKTTQRHRRRGRDRTYYQTIYAFVDDDGKTHRVTSMSTRTSPDLPLGTKTLVYYDPADPEGNWLAESEVQHTKITCIYSLAIGLGLPTVAIIGARRRAR